MIANRQAASTTAVLAVLTVAALCSGVAAQADAVLKLRGRVTAEPSSPVTIELHRWSTEDERKRLVTALSAPVAPAGENAGAAPAAAGRGGRGGRAGGPPLSPAARLSAAVSAAPTVGFVWGEGPTGVSVKYAWQARTPDGAERIVLVTDRRLDATPLVPPPAAAAGDAAFTLLEIRLDAAGGGEGRASLAGSVVADNATNTLALENYGAAPVLLKVMR